MAEAYSISSRLTFTSNAASVVADLIANFEKLDKVVTSSQSALGKLASELKSLGGGSRGINATINALEKLSKVQLGGNIVGEIERVTGAATRLAEVQAGVARSARETAEAWRSARPPAGGGRGGTGGGNGNGGGGNGGGRGGPPGPWPQAWRDDYANARAMNADHDARYRAQRGLAERENADRDANYRDQRSLAEREHADRERRRHERGTDLMNLGIGTQMAGERAVHTGVHAIDLGFAQQHLQTVAGADDRLSPEDLNRMLARARESAQIAPGSTVLENYHALLDVKSVTGSVDEAMQMLPAFAKLATLLKVMDKRAGGDGAFAAAKAEEIMGGLISEHQDANGHTVREIDPKLLQERLDKMARVDVATNARVTPQDYLAFAKQARVAGMTLSDEFIYEKLPAMIQVMSGPRAGTAMMSMAQVFEGGKLTPNSMGAMMDLGLASDDGIEHHVGGHRNRKGEMIGGHDKVHEEAIFDLDVMRHDPLEWVKKAQERMEAKGVHGTENQIVALMKMSQRSTIAGMLADLLKDAPAIEKEQQNIRHTRANASDYFAENDATAKMMQLQAAWTNFMTAMGAAATPDAVSGLQKITGALNYLGEAATNHPTAARVLTDVALGLGALGIALGTISTAIFIFGPAAKLLKLGEGIRFLATALNPFAAGGSAAAGLAGASSGLNALAATIATFVARLSALGLTLSLSGDTPDNKPATPEQIEAAKRRQQELNQGTGNTGHFWHDLGNWFHGGAPGVPNGGTPIPPASNPALGPQSSLTRPPEQGNVTFLATITLDGQAIAKNIEGRLVRSGSGPSGGSTGFDQRTVYSGGMAA